jgi:hypothetical protein
VDEKDLQAAEKPFIGPIRDPRTIKNTAPPGNGAAKETIRVGRYHCVYGDLHGNLCLDTDGICFEVHLTASEKWRLAYVELKSLQKVSLSMA